MGFIGGGAVAVAIGVITLFFVPYTLAGLEIPFVLIVLGATAMVTPFLIRIRNVTICTLDPTGLRLTFEDGTVSGIDWNATNLRISLSHDVQNIKSSWVTFDQTGAVVSRAIAEGIVARARQVGLNVATAQEKRRGRGGARVYEVTRITLATSPSPVLR